MAMRAKGVALTFVLAAGCFPHVQFQPAPNRHAPFVARDATYVRLHPVVGRASTIPAEPYMTLADGTRVAHPEDLSPLVDSSSRTARSTDRYRTARLTEQLVTWGGVAVVVAGGVVFLGSQHESIERAEFWPGPVAVVVGFITELVGSLSLRPRAERLRVEAFDAFDASLRQRLGICGDGSQANACPDTPGAQAPSSPRISN